MLKLDSEGTAKEALSLRFLRITGVVSLYWCVSISLVFINKYLLKSDELKLNAPLFVTFFQCLITCFLTVVSSKFGLFGVSQNMNFETNAIKQNCKMVAPLSIAFVCMVTFNNLCLAEVGVAFYTIARSQVTLFALLFTYLILGQKTSFKACLCCLIIVFGFVLGVDQEGDLGSLSVKGTVYGVIASACVALNAIYQKKVLPMVEKDIWAMAFYNNVNACLIFAPFILLFEFSEIVNFPNIASSIFWFPMIAAGCMGFFMGYVVGLQIKVTSPLTHNISGVAKACLQTLIATLYHQTPKPFLWWLSTAAVLVGTTAYSVIRSISMSKTHNSQSLRTDVENKDRESLLNKA